MTIAVCPKCGSFKHGALVPCTECDHRPETREDQATAIFLSSHHHRRPELEKLSDLIRGGEEVAAPQEMIDQFDAVPFSQEALQRGCSTGCVTICVAAPTIIILRNLGHVGISNWILGILVAVAMLLYWLYMVWLLVYAHRSPEPIPVSIVVNFLVYTAVLVVVLWRLSIAAGIIP